MKTAMVMVVVLVACGGSESDPNVFEHDFGVYSLAAGEEIDGVCMSWTLNNDEEIWVNTVSVDNDGFFHHANWFFVPDNRWEVPDGQWICSDNEFSELAAAIFGGTLYAQSTQTTEEVQQFQEGAAIRLPPGSRIIANTHLLNASDTAVQTGLRVRLDAIPGDEVTARLTQFRFNYSDLRIAPLAKSEFRAQCNVAAAYESAVGGDLELKLHYVLPHYHALGNLARIHIDGGERDGELLYEILDTFGEPVGYTFPEPVDLGAAGATGFRFSCGYDNPRPQEVGFGIGDQEMCVVLGFVESDMAFDAKVDLNETQEIAPDGRVLNSGYCSVAGIAL